MFYLYAFAPILAIFALLTMWAMKTRENRLVIYFAGVGGLLVAMAPWFSMWYTSNILNDPTANIGAGLLTMGQFVLAPLGSLIGAFCGVLTQSFRRPPLDDS